MSSSDDEIVETATAAPGEKRDVGKAAKVWQLRDRNNKVHRTYKTEAEAIQAAGSGGYFHIVAVSADAS